MTEKKQDPKDFSTCMEGLPFVQMMQKMMGRQAMGSLCEEMMKKFSSGGFSCDRMQSVLKGCCGGGQGRPARKEEDHDKQ